MKNTLKLTLSTLGLLTLPSAASLMIQFDTDEFRNPIAGSGVGAVAGSYTGSGVVDASISTGTNNDNIIGVTNDDVLITSIIDEDTTQSFNPEVLSMSTTFGLSGGTADLNFARLGSDRWKGWNIDNMAGVTELSIKSVLSSPIHGRSNTSFINGLPWGMSAGLLDPGTGIGIENFNITYTISDLYYLTDPDDINTATQVIPGTATALSSAGWDTSNLSSSGLVFESTDGFNGLGGGSDADNLLVRGLDADGTGLTQDDLRSFYATTFEMVITPKGLDDLGAPVTSFASDTRFVFSYDGDRTEMLPASAVPEPAMTFMMALSGIIFIGRRKRQ